MTIPSGVKHMLMSTFYFALMNVLIKKISHFPSMELVFFRCLVSMFICFTLIYKHKKNWQGSNRGLLLARGFFGTIALYLYFITIKVLPLGTAVTIQYMSPVFSSIIGIFLLKEKVKSIQWLFFTVSFAGVLIIKGFNLHIPVTILLIGVGSAISSGFAYNFIRSMKEKEDPIVVVLHFQIFGVITGIIFSFFEWQTPIGFEWLILLLIGIFTQLGQINLTLALQEEKIADVSILNYLGVLYAIGFGMLVFGESYEFSTVIGILFIVGGVLLNYFYKKKAIIKI